MGSDDRNLRGLVGVIVWRDTNSGMVSCHFVITGGSDGRADQARFEPLRHVRREISAHATGVFKHVQAAAGSLHADQGPTKAKG